eukprot:11026921-Alexandrium_andersonii.AAC.1
MDASTARMPWIASANKFDKRRRGSLATRARRPRRPARHWHDDQSVLPSSATKTKTRGGAAAGAASSSGQTR